MAKKDKANKRKYVGEGTTDSLVVLNESDKKKGDFLNLKGHLLRCSSNEFSAKDVYAFVPEDGSFALRIAYCSNLTVLDEFKELNEICFEYHDEDPEKWSALTLPNDWIGTKKILNFARKRDHGLKKSSKEYIFVPGLRRLEI